MTNYIAYVSLVVAVAALFVAVVGGNSSQPATGGPFRLQDSGIQANSNNRDVDHSLAGSSDSDLFYVDSGNDRVGISTSTPNYALHLTAGGATTTFGTAADNSNAHTCFEVRDSDGNDKRAYVSPANSWVIELGDC